MKAGLFGQTEKKPEYCLNYSLFSEECKFRYLTSFPLSFLSISAIASMVDSIGFINQRIERVDVLFSKYSENAFLLTFHNILLTNLFGKIREQRCLNKSFAQGKVKHAIECVKNISNYFKLAEQNLSFKFTPKNLYPCSQNLPLIQLQELVKYLNKRLTYIQNPFTRFYYLANLKLLQECVNEASENISQSKLICYEPKSFLLAYDSVKHTLWANSKLAYCLFSKARKLVGK